MSASAHVITLDGELTIYRAAELKPVLLALPNGDAAVDVDVSGVTEIDSAGVQLLLLAQREAQAVQRGWRVVGHSPAVNEVLTLLNLRTLLPQAA